MTGVLDLDGVFSAFLESVFKLHDRDDLLEESVDLPLDLSTELPRFLGYNTPGEFWAFIEGTPDFWRNLELYSWSDELFDLCASNFDDMFFATSPSLDPYSAAQKIMWIKDHYPSMGRKFAVTPIKHHFAGPGYVIIDDHVKTVERFRELGGEGILFPRRYNDGKHYVTKDQKLSYVKEKLIHI